MDFAGMINIVITHSQASDEVLQVIYIAIYTRRLIHIPCMRKSQKVNVVLMYLKIAVCSTEIHGQFKQREEYYIICSLHLQR